MYTSQPKILYQICILSVEETTSGGRCGSSFAAFLRPASACPSGSMPQGVFPYQIRYPYGTARPERRCCRGVCQGGAASAASRASIWAGTKSRPRSWSRREYRDVILRPAILKSHTKNPSLAILAEQITLWGREQDEHSKDQRNLFGVGYCFRDFCPTGAGKAGSDVSCFCDKRYCAGGNLRFVQCQDRR